MIRRLLLALSALAVLAAVWVAIERLTYQPGPWLDDLERLEHHMGSAYANLEWAADRQKIDLPAHHRQTVARIRVAGSDRAARGVLEDFVEAFGDPHLRVEGPPLPVIGWVTGLFRDDPPAAFASTASGADVCVGLGYSDREAGFRLPVETLPGFDGLPGDSHFAAGTFPLPDGRRVGLLRIAHFGEDGYRSVCEATWDALDAPRPASCHDDCLETFRLAVQQALLDRLAGRIQMLRAAGAGILVVDITGNGGGTEWVDPVARLLAAGPLHAPRVAFVRHAHWAEPLAAAAARLARDVADSSLARGARDTLAEALRRTEAAVRDAQTPCDADAVWAAGLGALGCERLNTAPWYASGPFDWLPPGSLASAPARGDAFGPLDGVGRANVWSGPVVLLVDAGTASASEYFAAMLRDSDAAVVLGAPTWGAGCGYTNGGLPAVLPHAGLTIRMPDCARLRRDGSNEANGIQPDLPLEGNEDDWVQALPAAIVRAAPPTALD